MSGSLPQQWLDKAAEDLVVAKLVQAEGHLAHVCFLSQQCIEKALKAYLLHTTNSYPRTHKLVDLLNECAPSNSAFSNFLSDCIVVDQYYIPTRYPDGVPGSLAGGSPGETEAQEALDAAERILHFVTSQLS
ncbi:MAG: HEPN domain-containing protein [Anaerolineales bacterium]